MALIIDQLSRDHRNLRLLLDIVEEKMNAYQEGQVPDFDLLQEIAEYVLHYPDLIHHPLEDLVTARRFSPVSAARWRSRRRLTMALRSAAWLMSSRVISPASVPARPGATATAIFSKPRRLGIATRNGKS